MTRPLLIDDRAGSRELKPYLDRIGSLRTALTHLPSADFCIDDASGPAGPCQVGIERKTVSEIVASVKAGKSDRFIGSQLPHLHKAYPVFRYLLVEGDWRENHFSEELEVWSESARRGRSRWRRTGLHYRAARSWLTTLELRGGIRVVRTLDMRETAYALESLYFWFQKAWEAHGSHLRFPDVPSEKVILSEADFTRRVAKELPGIGWKRSMQVKDRFGSVKGMVRASVDKWALIDGVTVERAQKIWKLLRGLR